MNNNNLQPSTSFGGISPPNSYRTSLLQQPQNNNSNSRIPTTSISGNPLNNNSTNYYSPSTSATGNISPRQQGQQQQSASTTATPGQHQSPIQRAGNVPKIPMIGMLAASRLRLSAAHHQHLANQSQQQNNTSATSPSSASAATTTTALHSTLPTPEKGGESGSILRNRNNPYSRQNTATSENQPNNNNNSHQEDFLDEMQNFDSTLRSEPSLFNAAHQEASISNYSRGRNNNNNDNNYDLQMSPSLAQSMRRNGDDPRRSASQSQFLSPRIEASVQLIQEGVHDVNDNEYEHEIHTGAIAEHKQSLFDSTLRKEQLKKKNEQTQSEMRAELAKAATLISELQHKLKLSNSEREGIKAQLHDEKLKVVQVSHDLENATEKIVDLKNENERMERELQALHDAVEERARKRAQLRQFTIKLIVALEEKARQNLISLEIDIRRLYTGGASTAESAFGLFVISRGKEGPFWMTNGAHCFRFLVEKSNANKNPLPPPQWMEDAVVKYRREKYNKHQSVQTIETAESRRQEQNRAHGTVELLERDVDQLRHDLDDARRETDRAKVERDQARNALDDSRKKEAGLRRKIDDLGQGEDETRRRLQAELDARDAQEGYLRGRIRDLEEELERLRRESDRERKSRSDAVRAAVWIEQMFQLLEEEERERRKRIMAQEAEEVAVRIAPLHAAIVHECAKQRREMMQMRSHLRSLTPPRSMSGITGKKPWYPPPRPASQHQTLTQQQAFARMNSAPSPSSSNRNLVSFAYIDRLEGKADTASPLMRNASSPSKKPQQGTSPHRVSPHNSSSAHLRRSPSDLSQASSSTAPSRINNSRLAVGVEQMRQLLDDLSEQYNPSNPNFQGNSSASSEKRKARTPQPSSTLQLGGTQRNNASASGVVYSRQQSSANYQHNNNISTNDRQHHEKPQQIIQPLPPEVISKSGKNKYQKQRYEDTAEEDTEEEMYHHRNHRFNKNDDDDDDDNDEAEDRPSAVLRRKQELVIYDNSPGNNNNNKSGVGGEEYYMSINPRHQPPPRKASPPPNAYANTKRRHLALEEREQQAEDSIRDFVDNDDDDNDNEGRRNNKNYDQQYRRYLNNNENNNNNNASVKSASPQKRGATGQEAERSFLAPPSSSDMLGTKVFRPASPSSSSAPARNATMNDHLVISSGEDKNDNSSRKKSKSGNKPSYDYDFPSESDDSFSTQPPQQQSSSYHNNNSSSNYNSRDDYQNQQHFSPQPQRPQRR